MAGPELFGTPLGRIAAGQEDLEAAKALSDIQLEAAQGRHASALAGKLEAETAETKRLLQIIGQQAAGAGASEPVSMADRLEQLAQSALDAGLVVKAQELSKNAALVRQREASATSSSASARMTELKAVGERAQLNGQLFGGAKNQQEWENAGRLWEFQTGLPNPYEGIPWSEELASRINSAAQTTTQRVEAEQRRLEFEDRSRFRRGRLSQHDRALELAEARKRLAEAREKRLARAGGGREVSRPTTGEISQVKRLIARDYPNLEASDLQEAAYAVAAEARALMNANRALNANAALQQAYNSAKAAGDFQALGGSWGGLGPMTYGYRGAGKTPETAATVPQDKGQLQKGRYYVSPSGVVGKWNGTGFEIVARGGSPLSIGNGRPEDEDEDEDED